MKDPAFLYYDGDAARDVSHMTRLERGCYFDLIQAQRKFGRLSVDLIHKILGKDFETCWESIKICLSYDNDMYFIEWLENSTNKRKEYSESRRKNRLPKNQEDTKIICESYDNHMENENVIENENINRAEKIKNPGIIFNDLDELKAELLNSHAWLESVAMYTGMTVDATKGWVMDFIKHLKAGSETGKSISVYQQYCRNWIKKKRDEAPKQTGMTANDWAFL